MKACRDEFLGPDGKLTKCGYGGCKFDCWVSTAVRIIEAVAKLVPVAAL